MATLGPYLWIDILREWFGGERYARDHEYLDANYGEQAKRVAAFLGTSSFNVPPVAPQAVPADDIAGLVRKLTNIADASRREDGTDIPLGEQVREAATALTSLSARLAETERQADLRLDRYLTALKRAEAAERKLEEHRKALDEFTRSFSVYTVEDDEGIRFSTGGVCIANHGEYTTEGMALLKFDALARTLSGASE